MSGPRFGDLEPCYTCFASLGQTRPCFVFKVLLKMDECLRDSGKALTIGPWFRVGVIWGGNPDRLIRAKQPKNCQKCQKFPKIAKKNKKMLKIAKNCQKWPAIDKNGLVKS